MNNPDITITAVQTWPEMVSQLRQIPLLGDPEIKPYRDCTFESRVINYDEVKPLSLYALKSQLTYQRNLRTAMLKLMSLDTLDQDHNQPHITFKTKTESGVWNICPPIIEESAADGGQPVLIDGEHRFLLSRELGLPVRVIWISRVPRHLPTVGLPVSWSDIKMYDQVPPVDRKRIYRFPKLENFPDISDFSRVKVTPENYLYFFYRNFTSLSTTYVR